MFTKTQVGHRQELEFILYKYPKLPNYIMFASKQFYKIYLDYNATTPLAEEVIKAISNSLKTAWGNPSSSHEAGR